MDEEPLDTAGPSPRPSRTSSQAKTPTLEDLAAELMTVYAEPLSAATTRQQIRQVIGQIMSLPGIENVDDLTQETVVAWVRSMLDAGLARGTINSRLVRLGTVCGYAVRRGYLDVNPVETRRRWIPNGYEGRPTSRPGGLTRDQVERLMVALLDGSDTWEGHRLLTLAAVILYAGLQRTEALKLRRDECDTDGRIFLIAGASLGRRKRAMPPPLAAILADWLPRSGSEWAFPGVHLRGPWTGGPPGQKPLHRLRAAGEAAGIAGLSFDRLRGYWHGASGAVSLPEFEARRPPLRRHFGPDPIRPGPRARPVVLKGPDAPPLVTGDKLPVLTRAQYKVVSALIEAGTVGLGKAQLLNVTGDALGVLRRLAASDPRWASVIHMARERGGRYRIGQN